MTKPVKRAEPKKPLHRSPLVQRHKKVLDAYFAGEEVASSVNRFKIIDGQHCAWCYDEKRWLPTNTSPILGANAGVVREVTKTVREVVAP